MNEIRFLPGERTEFAGGGWDQDQLAQLQPMTRMQIDWMLNQPIGSEDGRSSWQWVGFANGDLMCGFFPCGDAYFEHEAERSV